MAEFSTLIRQWYRLNGRDLPWRETSNPYNIWLSEIMLQQTRVEQGLGYYLKFIKAFPKVTDLAKASEEDVLNLWQGLGYYSRARNLHATAKIISDEYQGVFPSKFDQILALKGVGDYTASAIASIAFNKPHAVVDGNVYRVLSRYMADKTPIDSTGGKKLFKTIAQELLSKEHPGDHNQALMEIGALICLPKNPKCESCPLSETCLAYHQNEMLAYPVKSKKIKVRDRFMEYLVMTDGNQLIVKKREQKDIWQGLYDFPVIENRQKKSLSKKDIAQESVEWIKEDGEFKHILSHQRIYARFWLIKCDQLKPKKNERIIAKNDIEEYPLPQLLIRYIESSEFFRGE